MDGSTHSAGGSETGPRPPRLNDLSRLCSELNLVGARYLVVGGFAIIQAGFPRFTGDIDLLIDPSLENEAKVFQALRIVVNDEIQMPHQAALGVSQQNTRITSPQGLEYGTLL